MNKTNKILLIILMVLIIVTIIFGLILLKNINNQEDDMELTTATTTLEERKLWSEFLRKNPYISEIEMAESYLLDDTNIIKAAITSEEIETEYIVTEEINRIPTLMKGEGYKKSKANIEEYAKKIFNKESIEYNFVETYLEGEQYLMLDKQYVYFTELNLTEKEYILMRLTKNENNFEALIYEYEVNENNKNTIEQMLESGNINPEIEKSKVYKITGIMNNKDICILTKK